MKLRVSLTLALLLGFAAAAQAQMAINVDKASGVLEIRFKDKKLLIYAFATNQFKPYVRELYTLKGENVLRDAPPDHLHHHGLMYAVYVNGINFWEEREAPGVQKHFDFFSHMPFGNSNQLRQAQFTELVHWLAPTNREAPDSEAAALLIEGRTLTLTVDEKEQEVALRWESAFRVGKQAVKLSGPNYDGLGLRLAESFNRVAKFQNGANLSYPDKNQNVLAAPWTGVSGAMGGRDVMLALFGHPLNAPGQATFFTMLDPFAYLSATQALDQKPLDYPAHGHFALRYLITIYPENKSPDFLKQRYEHWLKAQAK